MKNFHLLSLLLLCCVLPQLQAQLSLGLSTGYVASWHDYGKTDEFAPEDGRIHVNRFHVTALAYLDLSKHIRIGVEPGFVQRGGISWPYQIFYGKNQLQFDYLDLPVMLSVDLPFLRDRFALSGKLGYGTAMMLAAHETYSHSWDSNDFSPTDRREASIGGGFSTSWQRWDHGVHASLGLSCLLKSHRIFLEAKGYAGLRSVYRGSSVWNRSAQLNLGYIVSL